MAAGPADRLLLERESVLQTCAFGSPQYRCLTYDAPCHRDRDQTCSSAEGPAGGRPPGRLFCQLCTGAWVPLAPPLPLANAGGPCGAPRPCSPAVSASIHPHAALLPAAGCWGQAEPEPVFSVCGGSARVQSPACGPSQSIILFAPTLPESPCILPTGYSSGMWPSLWLKSVSVLWVVL